jgi:aromatic-amino-acid transaminase
MGPAHADLRRFKKTPERFQMPRGAPGTGAYSLIFLTGNTMFEHVDLYAGDPILSLLETFNADVRSHKVNLSIGLYYDAAGKIPVLGSVREAAEIVRAKLAPHTYLPMDGLPLYREAVQKLVFGADSEVVRQQRVATIQSIGGSGAIRVAAEFLKAYFPSSGVWVSDPTWDNHRALFAGAGTAVHTYPYYDAATNGLKFDELIATFGALPEHSIVLLQPCCQNPTGIDFSKDQWHEIIRVTARRKLIPFMDMAYQGFGDSLSEDIWPIRAMADAGLVFVVSNSFSKNFSLYGERVGGLSIVCPTSQEASRVLGQLKAAVRRIYSNPPSYGAQLVASACRKSPPIISSRSAACSATPVLAPTKSMCCVKRKASTCCARAACVLQA